jgi:uncharacterized membrane protein YhdT
VTLDSLHSIRARRNSSTNAELWKRRLTLLYIAAWAFWAMLGLNAVIGYQGSTDGPKYPRIVTGVFLFCVVMPAIVLRILRQAVDRYVKRAPEGGSDGASRSGS